MCSIRVFLPSVYHLQTNLTYWIHAMQMNGRLTWLNERHRTNERPLLGQKPPEVEIKGV